jgi:hypothetical protein
LKIIGVVAEEKVNEGFFGQHIFTLNDIVDLDYDAILVTSIDDKMLCHIEGNNLNNKKVFYL